MNNTFIYGIKCLLLVMSLSVANADEKKPEEKKEAEKAEQKVDEKKERERRGYVGGSAGYGMTITPDSGGNFFVYGGRIGYDVYREENKGALSLGANLGRIRDTVDIGRYSSTTDVTALMLDVMSRNILDSGAYFAGRLGIGFVNVSASIPPLGNFDGDANTFVWGPALGYEFKVIPEMSIGAEAAYINTTKANLSIAGIPTATLPSIGALLFQFNVNYLW